MKKIISAIAFVFLILPLWAQEKEINLIDNAEQGFVKENLGENINTEHSEMLPIISADGNTLFVVRDGHPDNEGSQKKEDIWFSRRNEDGTWGPLQNIGKPLNNTQNNSVVSITPDGNTVFIMNQYNPDGTFKSGGLSVSQRNGNEWSVPQDIEIDDYYNHASYVGYTFSSDRNVMLLAIQRDETEGGLDMYYCKLKEDGSWTAPENMGDVINTSGQEGTPFLAADNQTLYFASTGHPGYGSFDIFVTRRLGDGWTEWSEPQNLGPEINSSAFDGYYTIPASGEFAYLASDVPERDKDIFRLELPLSARPKPVVLVSGKVLNSTTKEPIEAQIVYSDLETGEEVGFATSDPETGSYKIVLPAGKNYSFMADHENYFAISDNLDLTNQETYEEIEKDLLLAPVEAGQTIRLNNLFFDTAKADLKEASFPELKRLMAILDKFPNMKVEISGHTDNVGSDTYNQQLSEQRAQSVVNYLKEKGVEASRLVPKGYGESAPVESNDTEEGRAQNRRVEFKILSM